MRLALGEVALLLSTATPGSPQISIHQSVPLGALAPLRSAGTSSPLIQTFAVGDLTGDGVDDVIVGGNLQPVTDSPLPIAIFAGDGRGGFSDVTATIVRGGPVVATGLRSVSLADFNGDGRLDVYLGRMGRDEAFSPGELDLLLIQTPQGALDPTVAGVPPIRTFSHDTCVGDFDGNGTLDVLVISLGTGTPSYILLNDGHGNFTKAPDRIFPSGAFGPTISFSEGGRLYHSGGIWTCGVADMDGDGAVDLILGGGGDVNRILYNDGHGDFSRRPIQDLATPRLGGPHVVVKPDGTFYSDGTTTIDIVVADLDGDGTNDLILSQNIFVTGTATEAGRSRRVRALQVLIADGRGGYVDQTDRRVFGLHTAGADYYHLRYLDVNGDSHPDLVAIGSGATANNQDVASLYTNDIYLNDGTGRFFNINRFTYTTDLDRPDPFVVTDRTLFPEVVLPGFESANAGNVEYCRGYRPGFMMPVRNALGGYDFLTYLNVPGPRIFCIGGPAFVRDEWTAWAPVRQTVPLPRDFAANIQATERVFGVAERDYPQLFPPGGAPSIWFNGYYARCYGRGPTCLGTDADGTLFLYRDGRLINLGRPQQYLD